MKLYNELLTLAAVAAISMSTEAAYAYNEPSDTATTADIAAWETTHWRGTTALTWASKDSVYRFTAPVVQSQVSDTTVYAWRGERIGLEALVVAPEATEPLKVELGDWTGPDGKKVKMPESYAAWMRSQIATHHQACGYPDPNLPTYTIADMIDLPGSEVAFEAKHVRPVWCSIEVPSSLKPGVYTSWLKLMQGKKELQKIKLNVEVSARQLPEPEDYKFYLDLWQQPYAISRYYNVEPWSKEHLKYYEPYAKMLARAGQKATSVILFYEPWGEQSNDKFQPMVETTRHADGSYSYDYTILDRYVEYMDSLGVKGDIECFTMIPWEMNFRYKNADTGEYEFLKTTTDAPEYAALWTPFLKNLAQHFKEKGWYDRLLIVMDERPLNDMLRAYEVAQNAVPGIRMSLAGNYHKELINDLDLYTIIKTEFFPLEDLKQRREKGKLSLMYTCCATPAPSQFINSAPADGAYLPVYSTATGFDGYLHWSFTNWTNNPMEDARFHMFAPGDTYFVYPDGRSSVRYERMLEGIQMSEKVRLLREDMDRNQDYAGLAALEAALLPIRTGAMRDYYTTATVVNDLQKDLKALSER